MEAYNVVLQIGETYALRLGGLASAGYSWDYAVTGPSNVAAISINTLEDLTVSYAGGSPPSSSSIDQLFTVTGLSPGAITINLKWHRKWELVKPPLREINLNITVI